MDRDSADTYELIKLVDPVAGFVFHQEHRKNGLPHREDGPARVIRVVFEDDDPGEYQQIEEWFIEGEYERKDGGPAKIHRRMPHDEVTERFYFKNGKLTSGPSLKLEI